MKTESQPAWRERLGWLCYLGWRLQSMVLTLLVISLLGFALVHLMPWGSTEQPPAQMVEECSLDAPFLEQYFTWLSQMPPFGELRCSFPASSFGTRGASVKKRLFGHGQWAATLALLFATFSLTWMVALPLGIYAATHRGLKRERLVSLLGYLGLGLPPFLSVLLISFLVVFVLRIPLLEFSNATAGDVLKLKNLLPLALIVGLANMAVLIRHMRGGLLEVLSSDYVRAARAKGLHERVVIYKHALKNALNPLISLFGLYITMLFEGTLVVAVFFNLPLVEKFYFKAFQEQQPYMVATGLLFFSALLLGFNFVSDLLLLWSNPKIRYD